MRDNDQTEAQLIAENQELRQRLAALEQVDTERRRAEEELNRAHAELEERVKERAQEALRASEERYELAVRGAGVGIFDWNILTGKVYYSPRWKALLGYAEDEIGEGVEDWSSRLHPEERDSIIQRQDDFFAGTSVTAVAEYRLRHKDGSYRWIEASVLVVRDETGRACRLVGSHADITARKQAEESLKESEEKLKTLFQILPVGIALLDEDRRVVDLNPALEQILAMTREGLLRGDYARRRYLRRDGSCMPSEEFASVRAMSEGAKVSDVETGVVKEDGTTTWVSVSAAPLPVRGWGAAVVTVDITERRQAREVLERERQSLWHMLQASDHERQLISCEIHDGLAQYLAAAWTQFQTCDAKRKIAPREAREAYRTGVELVRQAHFESRRMINEVRAPSIDEIGLEMALSDLVYEQQRRGGPKIELHANAPLARLPSILQNCMYRIVQEAIANACKHSQSKKVTVAFTQENRELRLEVRDWGTGFDPEAVRKDHFGLEGIGQRARLLGGRLTIQSAPGSGTTVQVVVPICDIHHSC